MKKKYNIAYLESHFLGGIVYVSTEEVLLFNAVGFWGNWQKHGVINDSYIS